LQTLGDTQSSTDEHTFLQVPFGSHPYGAQLTICPVAVVTVWSPSQVAPDTHLPLATSHKPPSAQSVLLLHVLLQSVLPHE
jgi:hypothetical protein